MLNPNCDGLHCTSETGEVRTLPLDGGGNLIVCRACFEHEMTWRERQNRRWALQWALPTWDALATYPGAPTIAGRP
jgi:hypothetical protein